MFYRMLHLSGMFVMWAALCCDASVSRLAAAMIGQLKVVPDGSSHPPGDVIQVWLRLGPQESNVEIRVGAYLVRNGRQAKIRARRDANRAKDGGFEIRSNVEKPANNRPAVVSITVPYADMQIPPGKHRLGYVVQVSAGGRVTWTQASELTEVTVSPGARTRMRRARIGDVVVTEKRKVPLLDSTNVPQVAGDRAAGRPQIEIEQHRVIADPQTDSVTVNIPGGFQRAALPPPQSTPADRNPLPGTKPVAVPGAQLSQIVPADERQILFITNRARQTAAPGTAVADPKAVSTRPEQQLFAAAAAPGLEYGVCVVDVPVKFHHVGELEGTDWWQVPQPGRAFLVESTHVLPRESFLKSASERDVLVFVHGFNNSFESAVLRAAQLAYDIEFPGRAVAFSWPSAGDLLKYDADAAMVAKSASALSEGLWALVGANAQNAAQPRRKIHILAHSLGTHILLQALYELRRDHPQAALTPAFGQIVLAAPDVGAGTFNNLLVHAVQSCEQLTYYFCRKDTALLASQQTNRYEPVGLYPYFDSGLATIDADNIDTSFLGHVYFESSPQILMDMDLIFSKGLHADRRLPPLAGRQAVYGHDYWVFAKP